jgi:hypothetical protein
MAINQLGSDEEPTALNGSSHQLNDIRRPRPARQPNLGGFITKVEMEPDKIRGSRRDVSVSVIADRLPQSIVERKGKKWAAAHSWMLAIRILAAPYTMVALVADRDPDLAASDEPPPGRRASIAT